MQKNKSSETFYYKSTGTEIDYLNFEMMKDRHPDGEYNVVGELDVDGDEKSPRVKQLRNIEGEIAIQPLGTYKDSRYITLGFIPCVTGEYVAAKRKERAKFLLWLILPLLTLILLLGGLFLLNGNKTLEIDPNSGKYDSALKRPKNIDNSKILIPGYGKFVIEKGSDTIDTVFFNPEGNPCYFQFTLVEKGTNKVLYESKLVPPGDGITPIKIKKKYDVEGIYKVILKFKTVNFENTSIKYNGSDTEIKLIVKKSSIEK